ncbi:MAG TPA: CHAD domain-containing protein [Terriglobales bacterium]|nr:CHAD domain-containing protein [Terriglobales bacterium]
MAIDQARIQKPLSKLRKLVKHAPKAPPPDELHKLRTNARKLEARLSALLLGTGRTERKLLRQVRKIRKRAGKVRDLDVLTEYLTDTRVEGEENCRLQLMEYFGSKRIKRASELYSFIDKRRADLKSQLRKASSRIGNFLTNEEPEASVLATARALQLSSELLAPKRLTRKNLHRYRLTAKKLRYILQLAPGTSDAKLMQALAETKDAIGKWHDWEEMIAVATDVLDHGSKCQLIRTFRAIRDSKFREAVRFAEQLRSTFLNTSAKKSNESVRLGPAAINAAATLGSEENHQVA